MPETSSRVPLVRCPKCGHLLPELPPYATYCCGACGAYSRVEKRSSVDDGLSEKSLEERVGGEIVGFESRRENDRSVTSSRISKSQERSRYGEAISNSPIIESDLDLGRKFPIKRSVVDEFDGQSKSSGRSVDGDVKNSPLRESSPGGLDGNGKSTVPRSVRGGVRKTPMRESMLGDFDEQRSIERDVARSEELEAREKVGAWFDNVKEEVAYADRIVTGKRSPSQWLHYEASVDESELGGPVIQPSRTWRLDKSSTGSGGRADQIVDETDEYDDMYGRRRIIHDGYGMEQLRAERKEFGGVHGNNMASSVRPRFPAYSNDRASNFYSYYGYNQPRHPHDRFGGSSSLPNAEMNRAELFRLYNDLKEQLNITGDLPEYPTRRGHQSTSSADFFTEPDNYVHDELFRLRRFVDERAKMRPHHMNHSQVPGSFLNDHDMDAMYSFPPSGLVPNEFPPRDPSWSQYSERTPHRPRYYPQRSAHDYVPRHSIDSTYDPPGLSTQRENLQNPNLRTHVQIHHASGNRRYLNPDPASDIHDPYAQRISDPRFPYSTPHSLSSHSQRSADGKSDGGGSAQEHGQRIVVVKKNQLICHPFAGAAPLVICYNCSQLLRLPKKIFAMKKTQFRLQCGSCHTTLPFTFDTKKSHAFTQLPPKPSSTNVYDVPNKISESDHKISLASTPAGFTNSESYDFDVTGYTFQSTESEPSMHLQDRKLNFSEAEKRQGHSPSPSNVSKEDLHLDNAVNKTDAKEADVPGHEMGSTVKASISPDVQNADAPTELEINSDEIPMPDSKNDGDGNTKGKSSSAGSMARLFEDLSPRLNTSNPKADVLVNGQPLPHRVVRKAEKLAGPVSPGQYWYDSRAGFWGVMGSYCLGIIPPFIPEFGFPMPVDCAGGNTSIYVNGRELHEKDLELLAKRGFPRTANKWYVVDISGIVQDEDTGDTVVNLSRLAPSVEKAKRGFGMQPPQM